jgi:hypothetical protein
MAMTNCARCKKAGKDIQRCKTCKEVSYCNAECQLADWKRHKKTCQKPLPLQDVLKQFDEAHEAGDWRAVIKFEPRIDEMIPKQNFMANYVLRAFASAHEKGYEATGNEKHLHSTIRLERRRVAVAELLGAFQDKGAAQCSIGMSLIHLKKWPDAWCMLTSARWLGEIKFLFSVESDACAGLGEVAMLTGRPARGVELLRNALTAAQASYADPKLDGGRYEGNALVRLISALFQVNVVSMDGFFIETSAIQELEPLILRYCVLAKEMSRKEGCLCTAELRSLYFKALLHEVVHTPYT